MITKGIITNIYTGTNKVRVRIPLFENTGSNEKVELDSTISYSPGNLNAYNIGDVVFVGFEDNIKIRPIVIGKLYLGSEEVATNFSYANSLEVTDKAILPSNTTIGTTTIKDLVNNVKTIGDKLNTNGNIEEDVPIVSVVKSATTNLYGYENPDYTSENLEDYYIIKYQGSSILNDIQVRNYMKYMSGRNVYPEVDLDLNFKGAFLFTNGTICYPKADKKDEISTLKLIKVTKEYFTTEKRVIELIEIYGSGNIVQYDTTGEKEVISQFKNASSTDVYTGETQDGSLEIVDLSNKEEQ